MYKVKALSVGLPGNVIKHSGETINKGQIVPELAERLIAEGFLELAPRNPSEFGDLTKQTIDIKKVKEVKTKSIKSIRTKDIEPLNDELID